MSDWPVVAVRCNASTLTPGKTCNKMRLMEVRPETRVAALRWRCKDHRITVGTCYGCGRQDLTLAYDAKFGGIGCVDCLDKARERV